MALKKGPPQTGQSGPAGSVGLTPRPLPPVRVGRRVRGLPSAVKTKVRQETAVAVVPDAVGLLGSQLLLTESRPSVPMDVEVKEGLSLQTALLKKGPRLIRLKVAKRDALKAKPAQVKGAPPLHRKSPPFMPRIGRRMASMAASELGAIMGRPQRRPAPSEPSAMAVFSVTACVWLSGR